MRDPVIPGDSQGLFTKIGTDRDEIYDIHQIFGASRITCEGDEIGDPTDPDSESGKRGSPFDSGPGDLGENVEPDSLDVSPYHPGTRIFRIPPGQKTIDPVFSQRRLRICRGSSFEMKSASKVPRTYPKADRAIPPMIAQDSAPRMSETSRAHRRSPPLSRSSGRSAFVMRRSGLCSGITFGKLSHTEPALPLFSPAPPLYHGGIVPCLPA